MPHISIAPMLDWTDCHYRYFMRQITKSTILYTEMIVADAIIYGKTEKLLAYNEEEHLVVVQLGGSDPRKLAIASKKCYEYGYDEINLNVGCPSDRVKSGNFGACLMHDAALVANCIKSMLDTVTIPVTIKHRAGLDQNNDYGFLRDFVGIVADSGCKHFIVHARNAVLKGLSPKQNREIPPLKYDFVYRLKQDFPELTFTLNGGIKTVAEINQHLQHVDGVMIGREAYYNPYLLANFDQLFGSSKEVSSRKQIAENMLNYLIKAKENNINLHHITRHMIGLYHGCENARHWRYNLSNEMIKRNDIKDYEKLLEEMTE